MNTNESDDLETIINDDVKRMWKVNGFPDTGPEFDVLEKFQPNIISLQMLDKLGKKSSEELKQIIDKHNNLQT
jgi:hypothetical protein